MNTCLAAVALPWLNHLNIISLNLFQCHKLVHAVTCSSSPPSAPLLSCLLPQLWVRDVRNKRHLYHLKFNRHSWTSVSFSSPQSTVVISANISVYDTRSCSQYPPQKSLDLILSHPLTNCDGENATVDSPSLYSSLPPPLPSFLPPSLSLFLCLGYQYSKSTYNKFCNVNVSYVTKYLETVL